MNKSIIAVALGMPLLFASCQNQDVQHPDYIYQTVYFANQTPVQTITLGEDGEFDTSMDNAHQFQIYATLGGVNTNKKNRWVDYVIDNSMVDRVLFEDDAPVKALPSSYYNITSDSKRIYINKGNIMGAIDIQLTDAFFADPETPNVTYVVPVRLVEASDSILSGEVKDGITSPDILNADDWSVLPKNYTLYGIKYKNRYHGAWLSRGTVTTDNNGEVTVNTHEHEYWENEDIHYLTTVGLEKTGYEQTVAVPVKLADGTAGEEVLTCKVILNTASDGTITVSTDTPGFTASGSGKYTYHGAGNAWGALERDQIVLDFTFSTDYVIDQTTGATAKVSVSVKETLVGRDRQNKFETFTYKMK
ncbi:MAG: DUF1735 domain-containing protein [Muribaculaceae bacterium]|nr:DUF1735 domain-containing protein [Muribaculaceae bacterium]